VTRRPWPQQMRCWRSFAWAGGHEAFWARHPHHERLDRQEPRTIDAGRLKRSWRLPSPSRSAVTRTWPSQSSPPDADHRDRHCRRSRPSQLRRHNVRAPRAKQPAPADPRLAAQALLADRVRWPGADSEPMHPTGESSRGGPITGMPLRHQAINHHKGFRFSPLHFHGRRRRSPLRTAPAAATPDQPATIAQVKGKIADQQGFSDRALGSGPRARRGCGESVSSSVTAGWLGDPAPPSPKRITTIALSALLLHPGRRERIQASAADRLPRLFALDEITGTDRHDRPGLLIRLAIIASTRTGCGRDANLVERKEAAQRDAPGRRRLRVTPFCNLA